MAGILFSSTTAPAEPVACSKEAKQPKPDYSADELSSLVGFIRRIVLLYGIREADWNDTCEAIAKQWLLDSAQLMLTVYVDPSQRLTADLSYPESAVFEIVYFMREPNHIFRADSFHDDVTFGQIDGDVDGAFLLLIEKIYAPYFFQKTDWSVTNRTEFLSALHTFLVRMTALHHKLSGLTVLYVPGERAADDIEQLARDAQYVKRLETIAEHWVDQIRVCLSDSQQVVPGVLMCPSDEYDFWIYRC